MQKLMGMSFDDLKRLIHEFNLPIYDGLRCSKCKNCHFENGIQCEICPTCHERPLEDVLREVFTFYIAEMAKRN